MAKKIKAKTGATFVSPKEASERLGVTAQTLRNWAKKGKIGFIMLPSGRRHYNVEAILGVMSAPPAREIEKPVGPSPDAPKAVEVPGLPPHLANNPMALALMKIISEAGTPADLLAVLNQTAPAPAAPMPAPAPVSVPMPKIPPLLPVDVKAQIEALAQ